MEGSRSTCSCRANSRIGSWVVVAERRNSLANSWVTVSRMMLLKAALMTTAPYSERGRLFTTSKKTLRSSARMVVKFGSGSVNGIPETGRLYPKRAGVLNCLARTLMVLPRVIPPDLVATILNLSEFQKAFEGSSEATRAVTLRYCFSSKYSSRV